MIIANEWIPLIQTNGWNTAFHRAGRHHPCKDCFRWSFLTHAYKLAYEYRNRIQNCRMIHSVSLEYFDDLISRRREQKQHLSNWQWCFIAPFFKRVMGILNGHTIFINTNLFFFLVFAGPIYLMRISHPRSQTAKIVRGVLFGVSNCGRYSKNSSLTVRV